MKQDIVAKLEFGCPFKPGTIGEKDAELAEVLMQEGAEEIRRLRDKNRFMQYLITQVLHALPSNRDWLDPAIETGMKQVAHGGTLRISAQSP